MSPAGGPPVLPMMAALGQMPSGPGWSYEMKWDGIRVIAEVDEGVCRLWSRNARDVSAGYPELLGLAKSSGLRLPAVLDGEIVTLDENGAPSFGLLQRRMHVRDPRQLAQLINQVPVSVRLFDVVQFEGKSLLEASYDDRRGLLESLDIDDPFWEIPPAYADGEQALELSAATGLEGVVAKRRKSRYLPGKRSSDWVKVKPVLTRDVILCGWHPGEGNREGRIGSLYCGAYKDGELVLIGKVGSGLDFAILEILSAELAALEIDHPPFDVSSVPGPDRRAAHWLDPLLVAEVSYSGLAGDGRLRHPVWRGLRLDINPESVTL
jgi:bifunctional non-homologous end joining protein LigD